MPPPRNLHEYISAEAAAQGLEDMAATIRRHALGRPLVKYLVKLSYWNPQWADKTETRPPVIANRNRPPADRP